MKFHNRELMELFLEDNASEEQLNEILELVNSDEKFRQELEKQAA